ncbi:MAG: alpha/beta hydrolase [Niastella sp.]|nr:alpha/beta hydrolase [Niastella sp.]
MKKILLLLLLTSACYARAQQQYVTEKDINYYEDAASKKDAYITSQCKLDFYYPKGATNYATIVWFHGGGLTGGSKAIPKALMDKGYAVIAVGYRFSPKVTAPAYIEDAAAAVAWVYKHIGQYGGSTGLIFLSGHSAGGYLDLMITLDKSYLQRYNIDANTIAGIIPFSPQVITHFTIRKEQGIKDTQPTIDKYAPLYHVRADAPPLLLITGDREMEMLGRYEENAYMNRMMQLAGHKATRLYELDGFNHGNMPEPAFPLLLQEVATITKKIQEKK